MSNLTFANKSNAIRGFRQHFADLAKNMSNDDIRVDFLDHDGVNYRINIEAVADYQQDMFGAVNHNQIIGVPMLRRSVAKGSVNRAHSIFAKLPSGAKRKDAIEAAVDAGIAFYTARTQYQRWVQAA